MNILKGLPSIHREQVIEEVKELLGIRDDADFPEKKVSIPPLPERHQNALNLLPIILPDAIGRMCDSPNVKSIISAEEASEYLGLSKSYIYKLTHLGILPFSKPNGKKIYFERKKLEDWMLSKNNNSCYDKHISISEDYAYSIAHFVEKVINNGSKRFLNTISLNDKNKLIDISLDLISHIKMRQAVDKLNIDLD